MRHWFLVIFMLYFLVEGFYGAIQYKHNKDDILQGLKSRIALYLWSMIGTWLPTAAVLIFLLYMKIPFADIGMTGLKIQTTWVSYVVIIVTVAISCFFVYQYVVTKSCISKGMKTKIVLSEENEVLIPESKAERITWFFVALTAAITEEILFRGYLIYALSTAFSGLPPIMVLIISSMVFGLIHIYQGKWNVLKTGGVGLLLGIIYYVFGSLIPGFIVHFLIDYSCVDYKRMRDPIHTR